MSTPTYDRAAIQAEAAELRSRAAELQRQVSDLRNQAEAVEARLIGPMVIPEVEYQHWHRPSERQPLTLGDTLETASDRLVGVVDADAGRSIGAWIGGAFISSQMLLDEFGFPEDRS